MARKYELKQRAVRQAETRQRIVDAAIELHRSKGPARTTFTDIARLAGVQRHTLYRHFPDEHALGLACSGHFTERNPFPDAEPWLEITDAEQRIRRGLGEIYAYYERVQDMLAAVLRDAQIDPLTRELVELRTAEPFGRARTILAAVLPPGRHAAAALDLVLDFGSWQRLVRGSSLDTQEAADLAARLSLHAADTPSKPSPTN